MFSLLYYLHILPYPYPFVKHYFQKFLILFQRGGNALASPEGEVARRAGRVNDLRSKSSANLHSRFAETPLSQHS